MARMRFLCDVERCIDCGACVVACKEGHNVPVGINRRRVITINEGKPGEKSIIRCLHALFRCTVYSSLPSRCHLSTR